MNNYQSLAQKAQQVQRKMHNGQKVSSEELETLRQYAAANPSAANIASYAVGKRRVKDEEDRDNTED